MTARLLIVDDDPEITSALVRGLALHGYEAEAENRADRAQERLRAGGYSAAIVDVMLGADSGIDLVRAVRQAGVTLPIVMLSALSEVEQRAAGLEAGADDYIVKPFHFDELVARLRVQEHRASRANEEAALLCARPPARSKAPRARVALTEREFELAGASGPKRRQRTAQPGRHLRYPLGRRWQQPRKRGQRLYRVFAQEACGA